MSGLPIYPLLIVLLFWLSLISTGCSTGKAPASEIPAPSAEGEALLAMWLERNEGLLSLEGLAKVKVRTPEGTLSGEQVVIVARPGRLRAETLSPFGTPLLSLASDGRQLSVLLPGDNLYYSGAATAANLTRFTRMPIPPTVLIDILLWQPPLVIFEELSTFRTAAGGWRLLLLAGSVRQELIFDAAVRLEQARYYSGEDLQLSIDYGGFAESALLPRRIQLEQPPFALQADLEFREQVINQPRPDAHFSLQPPPGSQVISLDQPGLGNGLPIVPNVLFEGRK